MYYNLLAEMARKQIKQKDIAKVIERDVAGVSKRLKNGKLSLREADIIHDRIFPETDFRYLFEFKQEK